MGELVLVAAQLLVGPNDSMAPFLKSASVPFVAANIFQSLWCAAFRPKYKGGWMAVSFACLASTAFSLSKVHNAALGLSGWNYIIYGLPTSLHFGWVTAASLVNLNGAVAMQKQVSASAVAWVGSPSIGRRLSTVVSFAGPSLLSPTVWPSVWQPPRMILISREWAFVVPNCNIDLVKSGQFLQAEYRLPLLWELFLLGAEVTEARLLPDQDLKGSL
jgi:hypothetical protein